jgi:hypothetical protein
LNNEMNDHNAQQAGPTIQSTPRSGLGNVFRGLLLVADVGMGVLVMIFGIIGLSDPGPWGLDLATLVAAMVSIGLGVWLVISGVLLVEQSRPKCWTVGSRTHLVSGIGFFLLIAALWNQAGHAAVVHRGHMAMEQQVAIAFFSIPLAVFGIVWLVAASKLHRYSIPTTKS